jgi:hypothetical protein
MSVADPTIPDMTHQVTMTPNGTMTLEVEATPDHAQTVRRKYQPLNKA